MKELILKDESYAVLGACFEVYNHLGPGFLEAVYHEALEYEFSDRGIPFVSKPRLSITFKSRVMATPYEADFICYGEIVLEIKATHASIARHEAQLIHYLRATDLRLGILVNFGQYPDLYYKRFARTKGASATNS
ncbi:MAG TPA: GxxExxY protein [Lacipirellulaceae bacterium]|nr:GxxExxY protein [Lacipirellulaceae bacterium]